MAPTLAPREVRRSLTSADVQVLEEAESGAAEPLMARPTGSAPAESGGATVSAVAPVARPGTVADGSQLTGPLAAAAVPVFSPVTTELTAAFRRTESGTVVAEAVADRPSAANPVVAFTLSAGPVGFDALTTTSALPADSWLLDGPAHESIRATPGESPWSAADMGMGELTADDFDFEPITVDADAPVMSGIVDSGSEVVLAVGAMTGLFYTGRSLRRSQAGRGSQGPARADAV
jgi:hypothetical protein